MVAGLLKAGIRVPDLQCAPHPADIATLDFADAFAPLEPLVFRTSDPDPVLSVRALSVSPSGHLLLTDSRSFNLKVADRDGRVIQTIGGEGEGPGEFMALMDAAFLSDDRILALDGVWGVALPGGSLALGLDVTPAIHLFSGTGAHICTQGSEPPQWAQLLPRDEAPAMDQATREWIQQATMTVGSAVAGGNLYRQYRSSAEDGVSLLAEYDADLNLENVYTSLPGRLVGVDGETLFIFGDESADETRVLRYRAAQRE